MGDALSRSAVLPSRVVDVIYAKRSLFATSERHRAASTLAGAGEYLVPAAYGDVK